MNDTDWFNGLSEENQAKLDNAGMGETVHFFDIDADGCWCEYQLTKTECTVITEEEYERAMGEKS